MSTIPANFFLRWLVLLAITLAAPLAALAQPALMLGEAEGKLSSNGHLALLRDTGGTLTPAQAQAADGWQPLAGAVKAGYTHDTLWLRLEVERLPGAPVEWVVNFTNALLDDVRLYRAGADGVWLEQHAGEDVPRARWEVDARGVVFPIRLESPQREQLLIRLQTKNAMSTVVELWPRPRFDDFSRFESLYLGLYFGCYLLLILFHCFFWRMTGEAQSGWYLLYVSVNAATELLTAAIPQQVFQLPVGLSDPLLGLSLCLALVVGVVFASPQLGLPQLMPRFHRGAVAVAALVSAVGAGLVLAGHYGAGVILAQQFSLLYIVMFVGLALYWLARGHRPARSYLLIFGVFYVGVTIAFLRNLAVLPPNFFTNHAHAIGVLTHMVLMSLRLNSRYDGLRREKETAQAEAIQAVRRLNENLEGEVEKRTADLRQEIGRRQLLEQELRAALEVERRTKEEQQDFVAMVSHEFRTPLAIINTTAQQIARNQDAPVEKTLVRCQNLRDAARRMTALVDEYLTVDRMETNAEAFRPIACDPRAMLADILAEWPAERVRLAAEELPAQLLCDPGLVRVALRNLLANADRHAPAEHPIDVAAQSCAAGLRIAVSNRGDGIPEDEIPRLFQKYFRGRLAQHRPGAGLGLYLVQRIAQLHGGAISLEKPEETGVVTFALVLPAAMKPQATSLPEPAY